MLLTKECDYSVRILRALSDGQKKTVREICDSQFIPGQYAYKIIKKLDKAGFVQSVRGRDGGYLLSKPLDSFSLYDVIIAVDENLFIFECLRKDKFCAFKDDEQPCEVHLEFERLQFRLIDDIKLKTLQEILFSDSES